MYKETKVKQKILIADDSEMNRIILSDILGEEYEILEVEDGEEAVILLKKLGTEVALVLLDIVMPKMDGFEVLAVMNKFHWIEDIPVIMISAESSSSYVERSYELGVTDYINRPFDALVVQRRVRNTIMLYAKQKRLVGLVADQIYERQKSSSLMISILSHIVEFRNGESGLHVLHINAMTEILLKHLVKKTDQYQMDHAAISLISTASALHDIGKIGIPAEILNKPGRLTAEEYEIMKTHSTIGAEMLRQLPYHQDEPLVKVAYEICRWHHERYDGRGYPDGLKGEEIPISAQIVSLADVYDALTSERVYKKAFSHEKALEMILNGECGQFSPLLLECLKDTAESIQQELKINSPGRESQKEMRGIVEEMLQHQELSASERTLRLLEYERNKCEFLVAVSTELLFEYTSELNMVTLSDWGARKLGIERTLMDPQNNDQILGIIGQDGFHKLKDTLKRATPEQPVVQCDVEFLVDSVPRWHRCIMRAEWSDREAYRYNSVIGKVIDVHDEHVHALDLQGLENQDSLTGLWNRAYAVDSIRERLIQYPHKKFALILTDLDSLGPVNERYGHLYGDHVLKYMADRIRQCLGKEDLAARVGGDEFLIFFSYQSNLERRVKEIFHSMNGGCDQFAVTASMGVADTEKAGRDYEVLFDCAVQALHTGKSLGGHQFFLYDEDFYSH